MGAAARSKEQGVAEWPHRESKKGLDHESSSVREKDLQGLQDRAPQAHRLRHLQGSPAQAAAGLTALFFQGIEFQGFLVRMPRFSAASRA
jgi:hypothetical protein